MTLIDEGIEYTFTIHKIIFNNFEEIIGFNYELRVSTEQDTHFELKKDFYIITNPKKIKLDIEDIISMVKNQESVDNIEKSSIFVDAVSNFLSKKSVVCSLSLTNIF